MNEPENNSEIEDFNLTDEEIEEFEELAEMEDYFNGNNRL